MSKNYKGYNPNHSGSNGYNKDYENKEKETKMNELKEEIKSEIVEESVLDEASNEQAPIEAPVDSRRIEKVVGTILYIGEDGSIL